MLYFLFTVAAYVFMRAFEVIFRDWKHTRWYACAALIIGIAVLYSAIAAMVLPYAKDIHLLGFNPR